jgi:hypothetical protein
MPNRWTGTMWFVADAYVTLDDPWRWRDNPDLGAWVLQARDALRRGETLPLDSAPDSVTVKARGT